MTLCIITGAANAGKTGVLYARLRELLREEARPVLLLPSTPDVERAAGEFSHAHPIGLRITTFQRYVRDGWDQRGDGRAIVEPSQRRLLCIQAARESEGSASLALLAAECAKALGEQVGEAWRQKTGTHGGASAALSAAVQRYGELLTENGLLEPPEATHWLARNKMPTEPLLFHRFADFTQSQVAFVRAHALASEAWVTVTYARESEVATRGGEALIARLRPDATVLAGGPPLGTERTIGLLCAALFGAPCSLEAGSAVRFSLAEGAEAEAQRIAEEVRDALLEGAASSGERIGVVFRDPEHNTAALKMAFRQAGVQADFDVRTPFRLTPFGSAVCHLMEFAMTSDRSELLALLRSPFSGGEREAVRDLERSWRATSETSPQAQLAGASRVAPGLDPVLRSVGAIASGELDPSRIALLGEAVTRLFVLGYGRAEGVRGPRAEEDARAHRAAMGLLSEGARLTGPGVTLPDIRDAVRALSVRPGEVERPGHVQVMSVTRARSRRFDTLILGGLNAGEFPAAPSEGMLAGSAVEEVLRSFGGTGETSLGAEYEQYLFYMVATRAKNRLVFSARSTDDDGDPVRVSPFFEVACDSFRGADDGAMPRHSYRALVQMPAAEPSAGERENRQAAAFHGDFATPRLKAAARRAAARSPGIREVPHLASLASRDTFSASEIEAYLECPYRWFHSYAVRPKELERAVGPAEQGTFAHALLQGAYLRIREKGVARVSRETLGVAEAALEAAFAELDARVGCPGSVDERAARDAARAWSSRILRDDATRYSGFVPDRLEWQFGPDEKVDAGGFTVTGRVDRVDVDEQGRAVIIDYKRSKVPTAAHVTDLGRVQMPLYFLAARSLLGVEPVAGIYRRLSKREDRGLVLRDALPGDSFVGNDVKDAEEFSAIVEAGLDLARQAVDGIRAGRIPREPRKSALCGHCRARLVCGGAR